MNLLHRVKRAGLIGGATSLNMIYMTQEFANKKLPDAVKELGNLYGGTNDLKTTYKIKGHCNMWGGLVDTMLVTKATAVPAIMFHGTKDIVVPYDYGHWGTKCTNFPEIAGSACIYRRLRAAGKPAVLDLIPGGKHGPKELTHENMMPNTAVFFHAVMHGQGFSKSYEGVAPF